MGRTYVDTEQLRAVFSEMFDDVADADGMDGLVAQQMVINFPARQGGALPQAEGVGLEVRSTQARATPARVPGRLPRDRRQAPVRGCPWGRGQ